MAEIDKISTEKHEGDAMSVVHWKDRVLSGGADGKIKVWDLDLNLLKTIDAHEAYIYAMTVNPNNGKVYSSSCDGYVKYMLPPYEAIEELVRCDDAIEAMYCHDDILYTGDEKGVVTNWKNEKMLFKFNLVEEIKALAAEDPLIYTVRDWDVVISSVVAGKSGKYTTRAVVPGKSPLTLLGPIVNGKRKYVAFADRSGKGIILLNNLPDMKFEILSNVEDCHEMIMNSICGNEKNLFTGGYDNKVKGWSDLASKKPKFLGEVDVGSCVNCICCTDNNFVYIASSDGIIRRAKFSD